ncbi:hypothetical protein A2Z33_05235 [Candidatus Gottesmanbacteria bacterium RBG_16_52_11]|uniref:Peptidase S54 rhomboid domain-containing protein n=1 Tax=Candidatus Gottesmanbacteria bacterium RBG_16_52_11 TaxID=1798374 RepID=A0A1F5YQT0_9BACT|nr:MAG: hypothetical protein A2Z33_05235 [Candidatus Gottesmanbacteria bacterium RBG_16_52_11]
MIPLRDHATARSFPLVNYLIIAVNCIVFLYLAAVADIEIFVNTWGFIPGRFGTEPVRALLTVLTSIFLHGGFFHLISNMWFLHIFGDNIEDSLGHLRYLYFYLIAGGVSVLAQFFVDPASSLPLIGASGAISGVAGAYAVLYRRSRIETLVPVFLFYEIILLPTGIFLGYWFFVQLFSGIGALTAYEGAAGGVAWFAHIGGFVFGYLFAKLGRYYSAYA